MDLGPTVTLARMALLGLLGGAFGLGVGVGVVAVFVAAKMGVEVVHRASE